MGKKKTQDQKYVCKKKKKKIPTRKSKKDNSTWCHSANMAAVLTNWNSVAAPAPASAFLSAPADGEVMNQVNKQLFKKFLAH